VAYFQIGGLQPDLIIEPVLRGHRRLSFSGLIDGINGCGSFLHHDLNPIFYHLII
jgi:hypothetical protein